jgi:hypothetical protein
MDITKIKTAKPIAKKSLSDFCKRKKEEGRVPPMPATTYAGKKNISKLCKNIFKRIYHESKGSLKVKIMEKNSIIPTDTNNPTKEKRKR